MLKKKWTFFLFYTFAAERFITGNFVYSVDSLSIMIHQYDDIECFLAAYVLYDDAKNGSDYHYSVNKIDIRLKTRRHTIPTSSFVVKHAIESSLMSVVESRVAETRVI